MNSILDYGDILRYEDELTILMGDSDDVNIIMLAIFYYTELLEYKNTLETVNSSIYGELGRYSSRLLSLEKLLEAIPSKYVVKGHYPEVDEILELIASTKDKIYTLGNTNKVSLEVDGTFLINLVNFIETTKRGNTYGN